MVDSNEHNLENQKPISKPKIVVRLVQRSLTIGLISGSVLCALFGSGYSNYFPLFTLLLGAGSGLVLELVNGLLLSVITYYFFRPLRHVFLYQILVKLISAFIAGGGVAFVGLWIFSSIAMTPGSAVYVGLHFVLTSLIAGWAGALAGQNISRWYKNVNRNQQEQTARNTLPSSIRFDETARDRRTIIWSETLGWIGIALFSLLCSFFGYDLLKQLVCSNQDVVLCFSSPRLYTSFVTGYEIILPMVLKVMLILAGVMLLSSIARSQIRRYK